MTPRGVSSSRAGVNPRRAVPPAHAGGRRPGGSRRPVPKALFLLVALIAGACGAQASGTGGGAGADPGDRAPATALAPSPDAPEPRLPVTVRSAEGAQVTVTDASRIVPLSGSLAEVVFALGLGERVVARDVTATFPEIADRPVVTKGHDVSAESLLSLRPSVVLAQTDTGPAEALQQVRDAGVPVVVFAQPASVADIRGRVAAVAAALGVPEEGKRLAGEVDAAIEAARSRVPTGSQPPTVAFLYLRGQAGVSLIGGPGSGADSMIAAAGAIDAGTAIGLDRPFTPITSEALVAAAPDVILMTTTGLESVGGIDGLSAVPGVAQTPAGRDRRVVTVEDGRLYSFGPRTPEVIDELVGLIHTGGGS